MTPASAPKIKDYLLGRLTSEEETSLEETLFTDPDCVAEVWAVFADLSEQYLCGELPETERSQFERRLERSPALREMFENERALFRYAAKELPETHRATAAPVAITSPPRSRRFDLKGWLGTRPWSVAALSLAALLAAGLLFFWQLRKTPADNLDQTAVVRQDDVAPTPIPQPSLSPSPSPQPSVATSHDSQTAIATFFLPAQLLRSGADAPRLTIPRQTRTVQLELQLMNSDSARYSATLQVEPAETIREWKALSPQGRAPFDKIVLRVPAGRLAEASYIVTIRPIDGPDSQGFSQQYRFTVVRR